MEGAGAGEAGVIARTIIPLGWEKFQHKDVWRKSGGRPPWIKSYTALLHNDAYMGLSLSQRGLLHNLWLMYASSGEPLNEARTRHLLSTNKAESRHFQAHLEALSNAGFIEILSHPTRNSLATRGEKSREEQDTNKEHVWTNEEDRAYDEPVLRVVGLEKVLRDI